MFSKKLLKFINIPKSLGSYGLDDTFVMMASNMMKQKGFQILLDAFLLIQKDIDSNIKLDFAGKFLKFSPGFTLLI